MFLISWVFLLFVFNIHQVQFMLLIYSWIYGLPLKCGWLTRDYILKLPFPSSLLIGSNFFGRGGTICPSLLSMLGFGMAWPYTGFVYVAIFVSWYVKLTCCVWTILFSCSHSPSCIFSTPIPQWSLSLGVRGFDVDVDVPFRAEHSTLSTIASWGSPC